MQVQFDWTITPAAIISALWFVLIIPAYKFLHGMDETLKQVMGWLSEYRPHAHTERGEGEPLSTDGIVYPRTMGDK